MVLSRLSTVTAQVTDALAGYRFADAARVLYDFAWDEFCSFYVEMVKGRLQDGAAGDGPTGPGPHARRDLAAVAPDDPLLTEEVWQRLAAAAPERGIDPPRPAAESLMVAPWPEADPARQDAEIEAQFARFQDVLRAVRDIRAGRAWRRVADRVFRPLRRPDRRALQPMEPYFQPLANARPTGFGPDVSAPALSANERLSGMEVYVDLADLIDVPAEIAQRQQEVEKLTGFIAAKEKKLDQRQLRRSGPRRGRSKEAREPERASRPACGGRRRFETASVPEHKTAGDGIIKMSQLRAWRRKV